MPIYFLLSIWVLLSVGPQPTPQAYFERGALFYNALTDSVSKFLHRFFTAERTMDFKVFPFQCLWGACGMKPAGTFTLRSRSSAIFKARR
jgi:hypothetical protein